MKQQQHPWSWRSFTKGANRDLEDELLSLGDGEYVDACNFRVIAMQGDAAVAKKIGGEELLFPNIDNRCTNGTGLPLSSSYECIGAVEVLNKIIEFWADREETEPSLIRIDGQIVLMSADFPISVQYPLQIAKNESCVGGEVYITDFNVPPMIFSVKDLLDNSGINPNTQCTEKYFSDFNLEEHQLILSNPVDHPVFIKLTSSSAGMDKVLGTGGLPVGYYSYQIRYKTQAGDATGWSVATPQIPVIQLFDTGCSPYSYSRVRSKTPDISSPSPYGVHMRFRVNNENNYDFIEIRRNRWNFGGILDIAPISEIIGELDVAPGEISVADVLDNGATAEETLSPDEAAEALSAVTKAKAIRYYNNRLYLMNIEYASRDVDEEIEIVDEGSEPMFPCIENMGKAGHRDPYRHTYNKAYQHGEKYGFAIVAYDDQSQLSYARKIQNFDNYQFPNRREETSSLTEGVSYFGTVRAANVNGSVSQTHEVFDTLNCVRKTDLCSFMNILKDSNNDGRSANSLENFTQNLGQTCEIDGSLTNAVGLVTPEKLGYRPLTPVSQDDSDCTGANMRINTHVRNSAISDTEYNPKGFGVDYFAQGIAIKGVSNLPSWSKAFSVVRTKAAGRIAAQGLGFYRINGGGGAFGANATKETDRLWLYAPDIDPSIGLFPNLVDDIRANKSNYAIQAVSPLGFFTEVYSFDNNPAGADKQADIMVYCNLMKDLVGSNAEVNPEENPSAGIIDSGRYYTAYGKWRASSFSNLFYPYTNGGNGNYEIGIQNFDDAVSGRARYYDVQLTEDIYDFSTTSGSFQGDSANVQNWHEPAYIVNIVRKNIDVPDQNITEYVPTGHYQKLSSLIGVSDGSDGQEFILVDERWEDCMPFVNGVSQNDYAGYLRFVHVDDGSGITKKWLNVANLNAATIQNVLTQLATNGSATISDPSGPHTVYGVYGQTQTVDGTAPIYSVVFSHFDTNYNYDFFVPISGSKVYVNYDERIPIRVFGGDVTVGDAVTAFKDNLYNEDADPETSADDFRMNIAFPYRRYEINHRIYLINNANGILGQRVQDENTFRFDDSIGGSPAKIRQLCAMFTVESRIAMVYRFNEESVKHTQDQTFILKNYVYRPNKWKSSKFNSGTTDGYDDCHIQADYETDYGDEWQYWGYGGFRFLPRVNTDYSHNDTSGALITSVPQVGFEEITKYCTRVIWSEKRDINVQNSPGVRTFPGQNFFDISDDTGEIKYAYDSNTDVAGNNLYAFTEDGCCMLLVDKRIINEINGNELATAGSDIGGIQDQKWISKTHGLNGEMWRSVAEFAEQMFFSNVKSSYMFAGNQFKDIGREGYHSRIYPDFLKDYPRDYSEKLCAIYDAHHNEYWVTFQKIRPVDPDEPGANKEWCIEGEMDVTNITYNPETPDLDDTCGLPAGVAEGVNLVLHPTNANGIVMLGGRNNNLLTHEVRICVSEDSAYPVEVRFARYSALGAFLGIVSLGYVNPGECMCYTPTYPGTGETKSKPTWAASECDDVFQQYDCPTISYGIPSTHWNGSYDYLFDKYVRIDNKVFGMKNLETYELNKGFLINGQPVYGVLLGASSPEMMEGKEFIRIRVNSDNKPVKVQFFNNIDEALTGDVQAELDTTANALALKDYYGYEQYIPRKLQSPYNRMQGRLILYKIIHNLAEDFKVISVGTQYKKLK